MWQRVWEGSIRFHIGRWQGLRLGRCRYMRNNTCEKTWSAIRLQESHISLTDEFGDFLRDHLKTETPRHVRREVEHDVAAMLSFPEMPGQ